MKRIRSFAMAVLLCCVSCSSLADEASISAREQEWAQRSASDPMYYLRTVFASGMERLEEEECYPYYQEKRALSGYAFREGIAWITNGEGLYGAINTKGKTVIPFEWETWLDLGEGYSFVSGVIDGRYTTQVLDRKGQPLFGDDRILWESFGAPFQDGYTWAYTADGAVIVSAKGEMRELDPFLLAIGGFSNGRLLVEDSGGFFGYVDTAGKLVIDCEWEEAYPFSEGYAVVKKAEEGWRFINRSGGYLSGKSWSAAQSFCNGRAAVMNEESLWGYINLKGKQVIPCKWLYAGKFYNKHAPVAHPDLDPDMAGFIDGDGVKTVDCAWEAFGKFSQNAAPVYAWHTDGWVYINQYGNQLTDQVWEQAYSLQEGLGLVYDGEKYGFVNKSGRLVIDCVWEDAMPFSEGLAWVSGESGAGFINTKGQMVISLD